MRGREERTIEKRKEKRDGKSKKERSFEMKSEIELKAFYSFNLFLSPFSIGEIFAFEGCEVDHMDEWRMTTILYLSIQEKSYDRVSTFEDLSIDPSPSVEMRVDCFQDPNISDFSILQLPLVRM
jgi:hypothetical protein